MITRDRSTSWETMTGAALAQAPCAPAQLPEGFTAKRRSRDGRCGRRPAIIVRDLDWRPERTALEPAWLYPGRFVHHLAVTDAPDMAGARDLARIAYMLGVR